MPGSIVDLSNGPRDLPDLLVVDTNLIVERILLPSFEMSPSPVVIQAQRADFVFHHLSNTRGTGIVLPAMFQELIHVAVRTQYNRARRELGDTASQIATYGVAIKDWTDLYKRDPAMLRSFAPKLDELRRLLVLNDLLIVDPTELAPIDSGRSFDAELVHLIGRYGLDSNDAVILMEAQRCGVTDIVTFDRNLLRAQADFTIYTWL